VVINRIGAGGYGVDYLGAFSTDFLLSSLIWYQTI